MGAFLNPEVASVTLDVFRGMASSGVEVVETLPIEKDKPTVVIGLAGPGFIGSTAMMYIVRNRGFRQRAYLRSQLIPPMMLLIDGKPTHAFRIYSDGKGDLLLITTETLMPAESSWPLSLNLMEWLLDKGATTFISIDGMPSRILPKERIVLGFSNDREDLAEFGIQPTKEGAVSGMNACLLEECLRRGLSWTSLFVPTDLVSTIDFGGSAAVIEILNRMFKLGVDVTPLKRRDEAMREMAERRMKARPRGFLDALRRRR